MRRVNLLITDNIKDLKKADRKRKIKSELNNF